MSTTDVLWKNKQKSVICHNNIKHKFVMYPVFKLSRLHRFMALDINNVYIQITWDFIIDTDVYMLTNISLQTNSTLLDSKNDMLIFTTMLTKSYSYACQKI